MSGELSLVMLLPRSEAVLNAVNLSSSTTALVQSCRAQHARACRQWTGIVSSKDAETLRDNSRSQHGCEISFYWERPQTAEGRRRVRRQYTFKRAYTGHRELFRWKKAIAGWNWILPRASAQLVVPQETVHARER